MSWNRRCCWFVVLTWVHETTPSLFFSCLLWCCLVLDCGCLFFLFGLSSCHGLTLRHGPKPMGWCFGTLRKSCKAWQQRIDNVSSWWLFSLQNRGGEDAAAWWYLLNYECFVAWRLMWERWGRFSHIATFQRTGVGEKPHMKPELWLFHARNHLNFKICKYTGDFFQKMFKIKPIYFASAATRRLAHVVSITPARKRLWPNSKQSPERRNAKSELRTSHRERQS